MRDALDHHLLVRRGDAIGFRHAWWPRPCAITTFCRVNDAGCTACGRRRSTGPAQRASSPTTGPGRATPNGPWPRASPPVTSLPTALAAHEAWAHYSRALQWWTSVDDPERRAGRSFIELSAVAAEAAHRGGDRQAAIEVWLPLDGNSVERATPWRPAGWRNGWAGTCCGTAGPTPPTSSTARPWRCCPPMPGEHSRRCAGRVRAGGRAPPRRRRRAAVGPGGRGCVGVGTAIVGPRPLHAGRALLVAGDSGAAEVAFVIAAELAEQSADIATLVAAVSDRADILASRHRLAVAVADASACSVRLGNRGLDEPCGLVMSAVAGGLELRQGRVQTARERAEVILARGRLPITTALGHLLAGSCELVTARPARAREHLEMGRFLAAPVLDGQLAGALALARAELALAEGLLDEASARVDDGIAATLTSGDDELRGRLALVGVRAADDRVRSLDRRATKRARAHAEGDRDRCIRLAEDVVRGRVDQPGYAPIAAELAAWSAPTDGDGAEAWLAAAAAWRRRRVAPPGRSCPRQRCRRARFARASAHALPRSSARPLRTRSPPRTPPVPHAARRIAERAGLGPVAASTPEPSETAAAPLTAREREVLELVVDGATNRRIATTLFISEKTASVHVSRILTKLGVTSRHAAAAGRPPRQRLSHRVVAHDHPGDTSDRSGGSSPR